jgi:hypothetical protein
MKLQFSSAILLWVLSDPTGNMAEAWIPTQLATTAAYSTRRSKSITVPFSRTCQGLVIGMRLHSSTTKGDSGKNDSSSNANDGGEEDEEECPDEEECEIDWSKMPGGDDSVEEPEQAQASDNSTNHEEQGTETTAKIQNDKQIEEEHDDDELVPNPLGPTQVRSLRLRLEMQWQMTDAAENCDVYHPATCGSDPCPDCKGRGWNECRFCLGTTVLWMRQPNDMSSFTTCSICQQGTETCKSCQGSGWISGWAKLQLSK